MPIPDARRGEAADAALAPHGAASLAARDWSFTPAGRAEPVLAGLDLTVEPGERVLLLGASGSGKSTLLQAFAGVLGGDDEGVRSGALEVDGVEPGAARGRVGLLLQDPDAQLVLARAGDDVAFGPENLGVPADEIARRVPQALAAVGLDLPLDADTTRLSGGQKQRLALAGVLALRPGALLLDEPTAQLDPAGVREVAAAVAALVADRSMTLLVVEHRVDVWAPLVDRVVVLEHGRVVADGPVADVLREQGERLAARGVWVPGRSPEHPAPASREPGQVLLAARGLAVRPAGGAVVQRGLDLDVRAGEVVALTGVNGAGKTTLALTLAGLLDAAEGQVTATDALLAVPPPVDSPAPASWSSRALVARLGVVFQNPEHQFVAPTVRAELEVGPRALGRDDAEARTIAEPLLDRLRLRHLTGSSPFTLSGGEQRRLSVATALATAPPVLVLDEPSFGQDARTWAELAALLAAHRDAGGAVVMATHDRELIAALGAREVVLPAPAPAPRAVETPRNARRPLVERLNPVAAIAASLLPALLLIVTLDVVSAGVALALQLALLPLLGVPWRLLLLRLSPVLVGAPLTALTLLLYGEERGRVYAEFLLVRISDGSIEVALATLLRVLAIGIPAIALFARPDATRLGDALGQNLRLPARFVLGAVAALRLVTLLRDDARTLERARRARGTGDRGRIRRLAGLLLALLVLSIRRGSALAIAMEARGFGAPVRRTWVRPSPWRGVDTAAVLVGLGISVAALGAALLTGSFRAVIG
ncbi:ATP-binding cassette domain-containing protein [Microcella alkalica]|uniref:ATP-binding cassette domain-containing protein n=1 Tax=Microcella alkalica TaxID=355930 RepID=UPI00145EDBB9|nr:ATP-binding cassette domain-containing protein [Microcella alkalica]